MAEQAWLQQKSGGIVMSEIHPAFVERYDRYYTEMKKLDVPLEVWRDVLVEMYSPVDWNDPPRPFKNLNGDLDPGFSSRASYDLTRRDGVSDHDYARGLLMWSETVMTARKEYADANIEKLLYPGETLDPEWHETHPASTLKAN
jgi:hypothetical protein